MMVLVNGKPFALAPGMTVYHALVAAGLLDPVTSGAAAARDQFGNRIGLGGALAPGMEITVSPPGETAREEK